MSNISESLYSLGTLKEEFYTAVDVVVYNNLGLELSRQAVSSTEEMKKYLVSLVDALEPGDYIKIETVNIEG